MRKKQIGFRRPVVIKNKRNSKQPESQPSVDPITGKKIPKSFVFARGKLPVPLKQLQMDLRKLMLPYTAPSLKEKKRNSLRDFLNVVGPMGVTHFLILSKTASAPYLRVATTPQPSSFSTAPHAHMSVRLALRSFTRYCHISAEDSKWLTLPPLPSNGSSRLPLLPSPHTLHTNRLQSTFIRITTTTSADIAASSSAACLAISS